MSSAEQKMRCKSCGAVWFSASAIDLVQKGARCMRCDGPLELAGSDPGEPSSESERDGEALNES